MVRFRGRSALLAAVLVIGVAAPSAVAAKPKKAKYAPQVVVAVANQDINPYHRTFYRPQNTQHPCKWVKGFDDCSVPALNLSIGKYDRWYQIERADKKVWDSVKPGQWYWIPKTNIIGFYCTYEDLCGMPIQEDGTAAASSVISEAPDALLLTNAGWVSAPGLADPPVIPDIQTQSWGRPFRDTMRTPDPAPFHFRLHSPSEPMPCPPSMVHPETQYFLPMGDYLPETAVAECLRKGLDVQLVGGATPGSWHYDSTQGGDFVSWMCRPSAGINSLNGEAGLDCGTALSTATAAGAAAGALLRIRRQDRYVGRSTADKVSSSMSRDAFVAALRAGASYTPKPKFPLRDDPSCDYLLCKVGWAPLPPEGTHLFYGYGWLDSTVVEAIVSCARGRACPAKSDAAQDYLAARQQVRDTVAGA